MAILSPTIENINNLTLKPTAGELFLLSFLKENLSDEYEIYFQPMLNGDFPDIIIMRRGYWLMIIEVKDWILSNYYIEKILKNNKVYYNWKLRKNDANIKSPFDQVDSYKDNIYNTHIDHLLLEYQIKKGDRVFGLVKTAVYFHNESVSSTNQFFGLNRPKYANILCNDGLSPNTLFLNTKNEYFSDELYTEFQRILQPSFHTLEQGMSIEYTPKQLELTTSRTVQQKIKWVAWCWKTLILAKRAVNAHIRTWGRVLILTYNITLRNYIHDNISKVRQEFYWDNFYITNYHSFIKVQANRLNKRLDLSSFDNPYLFADSEGEIEKYNAIFIDEIQDYQSEWIDLIKRYFLEKDGEFVVFGDEKQNIYDRKLDQDKSPNTRVIWAWTKLNQSFRLSNRIASLATQFQKAFFWKKYTVEDIEVSQSQTQLFLERELVIYKKFSEDTKFSALVSAINNIISENKFHNNDICFLSSKINIIRSLDYEFRIKWISTKTSFETQEVFDALMKQHQSNLENLKTHLKTVRNNKKFHFWMNDGNMKFSTIHSFKWWEIPTLFLIITKEDKNNELIYTAITRCRHNLIVINLDNEYYDNFFTKELWIQPDAPTIIPPTQSDEDTSNITVWKVNSRECWMSDLLSHLKTWAQYKICILWELAVSNRDFTEELSDYFIKEWVRWRVWGIDFISNREMKQKNILKQFRKWWTSYSLIITWQIHHHSSKGNEEANLLEELKKDKYVQHIVWCDPHNKLTVTNWIECLDEYLTNKLKSLNDELSKIENY